MLMGLERYLISGLGGVAFYQVTATLCVFSSKLMSTLIKKKKKFKKRFMTI